MAKEEVVEKKKKISKVAGGAKTKSVAKASGEKKQTVKEKKVAADNVSEENIIQEASVKKEEIKEETPTKVKKASVKKVKKPEQKKVEDFGTIVIAKANNLKGGVKKLVLIANSISGLKCDVAVSELEFSKKRVAKDVKNVLQSAIANAQNNHNLDLDRLYVKEAIVGKSHTLKRWRARAKGRGVRILKKFSRIEIKLVER